MATTPANANNNVTTGITGFTGTGFTGTPVTQYDVIVGGATSSTLSSVGPGTSGQLLQSGGNAANPAYSTSTYPSTNAINTLLYASSANTMAALATANTGVLATNGSGVPSITSYPQVTGLGIGASPGATSGLTFDGTNFVTSLTTGTWTPSLQLATPGSSSFTYAANGQIGRYFQFGSMVLLQCRLQLTNFSIGTGSGNVYLTGVPFSTGNITNQTFTGSTGFQNITFGASVTYYNAAIGAGLNYFDFQGYVSAGAFVELQGSGLTNTSVITINCWISTV